MVCLMGCIVLFFLIRKCLDGLCDLSIVTCARLGQLKMGGRIKGQIFYQKKLILAFRFDSICLEMGQFRDIAESNMSLKWELLIYQLVGPLQLKINTLGDFITYAESMQFLHIHISFLNWHHS